MSDHLTPAAIQDRRRRRPKTFVFFFDIDNALYPKSTGLDDLMMHVIREHIDAVYNPEGLEPDLADKIMNACHVDYHKYFSMLKNGLLPDGRPCRPIDVDAYERAMDDGIRSQLDAQVVPDARLTRVLTDLHDQRHNNNDEADVTIKLWAFTNANRSHGETCLRNLGIRHLFDGLTFCDFARADFTCKPNKESYERAMDDAAVDWRDPAQRQRCFFLDDSRKNVRAAKEFGWVPFLVEEVFSDGGVGVGYGRVHASKFIDGALRSIHTHPSVQDLPRDLLRRWEIPSSSLALTRHSSSMDESCELGIVRQKSESTGREVVAIVVRDRTGATAARVVVNAAAAGAVQLFAKREATGCVIPRESVVVPGSLRQVVGAVSLAVRDHCNTDDTASASTVKVLNSLSKAGMFTPEDAGRLHSHLFSSSHSTLRGDERDVKKTTPMMMMIQDDNRFYLKNVK